MRFHQYDPNKELTFEELSFLIHQLRMMGWGFVDQEAVSTIQSMIDDLPTQEILDGYKGSDQDLNLIKGKVTEIIELANIYGQKNKEFETRHKSLKKLPPRYEVKAASVQNIKENKMQTEQIKRLVEASAKMDELGKASLAEKTLKCAKKGMEGEDVTQDLLELGELYTQAGLEKEAVGFFQNIKDNIQSFQDIRAGKKEFNAAQKALSKMFIQVSNAYGMVQKGIEAANDSFTQNNEAIAAFPPFQKQVDDLEELLNSFTDSAEQTINQLAQVKADTQAHNKALETQMNQTLAPQDAAVDQSAAQGEESFADVAKAQGLSQGQIDALQRFMPA